MEFKQLGCKQWFFIIFIIISIVYTSLGKSISVTPSRSEVPSNIDEIVNDYIRNTKQTYDYRAPAINEEVDKILYYIQRKNSSTTNLANYDKKLEDMLQHLKLALNKFTNNCGINDVLMILAPEIIRDINESNDTALINLAESFRNHVKMDEVERQILAVKRMETFIDGRESSDVLQFYTKYSQWEREHCYGVSVYDK
ncbi:uncharacterized protein LOC142233618 [Haematobia irritans]|uniref:uncharacterized protein LOC142233618 n=1 Tax=Haematobia irritans TaxID=7368 RepID=UPI003F50306E